MSSTIKIKRQWSKLRKRAAYAPKGSRQKRQAELREFVTALLRQEVGVGRP